MIVFLLAILVSVSVFSGLTFVFVAFGFDTKAGDDHDDDNYRSRRQGHHKPNLSIERWLRSSIPRAQVSLGRSGYLWKKAPSLFNSRQFCLFTLHKRFLGLQQYLLGVNLVS